MELDHKLDEYRNIRTSLDKKIKELVDSGEEPSVVAKVVVKVANSANPKIRNTAGSLACRLKFLRRFAPAFLVDAGLRNDLRLDA